MNQDKTHSWELYLHYYACPECGLITESRHKARIEKFICPRCDHKWTQDLPQKKSILPIFKSN